MLTICIGGLFVTIVLMLYGEAQVRRRHDYDTAIEIGRLCKWLNIGLCVIALIAALVDHAG